MKAVQRLILCALVAAMATAMPSLASSVDYTTPGTYDVPANCGFEVIGGTDNFIRVKLSNDVGTSDLFVLTGHVYPLRLAEVTIYAFSPGIRVNTTPSCDCTGVLNPSDPSGTCYTRAFGADECEIDPSRPNPANPKEFEPGPDIPLVGIGFYSAGAGEIDWLSFEQTDYDYWNTARVRTGQWKLAGGGVRRCRLVEGSGVSYLTIIAP